MSTASRKDIELQSSKNGSGFPGTRRINVAASATLFYPGDIIGGSLADVTGSLMATNSPVVATDFIVGVATTTSTNTAATAGYVEVIPVNSSDVYLISPKVAATWDTQAKYDALVGKRVLIDLTTLKYTILAADGATSGCVIQPLDISKYPGKVAFSFRAGCSYLT